MKRGKDTMQCKHFAWLNESAVTTTTSAHGVLADPEVRGSYFSIVKLLCIWVRGSSCLFFFLFSCSHLNDLQWEIADEKPITHWLHLLLLLFYFATFWIICAKTLIIALSSHLTWQKEEHYFEQNKSSRVTHELVHALSECHALSL
jgi:hypothetical protein